jgi:peroxiredoxin
MKKNIIATLFIGLVLSAVTTAHARALMIGKPAPNFTVMSAAGSPVSLSDFKGKVVVLEWTAAGCPIVQKHYADPYHNMQTLQKTYTAKGVIWLSICSSAPEFAGYYMTATEADKWVVAKGAAPTAYLLDSDGKVGHLYDAKATPHMFIIGKDGTLLYNGAIDSIHSAVVSDIGMARNLVSFALTEILAGKPVSVSLSAPYGCVVRYATYSEKEVDGYSKF